MLMDAIEGRRRDTANLAARMQPRRYGAFLTENEIASARWCRRGAAVLT